MTTRYQSKCEIRGKDKLNLVTPSFPSIPPRVSADSSWHSWNHAPCWTHWLVGLQPCVSPCSLLFAEKRLTLSVKNAECSLPCFGENTVILEWIFWVFLKCTWWSLTKYPALTAQHKVAGPCHCPTPAGAGALCLTSTPASMGQGPSLPPTAPSPAPSCTTMDFTRWSVTRANRHFHTLHLPLKAHRLQVRTFQLHQMPCGATSTSTTEGCAPKLRSQCHLSVASYRKYFPHMKGLYFCLSCSEIHRPVNKFQETIKSEKAVSN